MKITSREYKVILDHRMFADRKAAAHSFYLDLGRAAGRANVPLTGAFETKEKRYIEFLDTPGYTFKKNRLILRRRRSEDEQQIEFTLKCRNEDRYIASETSLRPGKGFHAESKFEEDIAPPCRGRFSHSSTIDVSNRDIGLPKSVGAAAELFPILGKLERDGAVCDRKTRVEVVADFVAHERVLSGPEFELPGGVTASVALIFWAQGWKERTVATEFSFRYRNENEKYALKTAEAASTLFTKIQELDWCLPAGTTKTQFIYGGDTA